MPEHNTTSPVDDYVQIAVFLYHLQATGYGWIIRSKHWCEW